MNIHPTEAFFFPVALDAHPECAEYDVVFTGAEFISAEHITLEDCFVWSDITDDGATCNRNMGWEG